jgi:SanA protein
MNTPASLPTVASVPSTKPNKTRQPLTRKKKTALIASGVFLLLSGVAFIGINYHVEETGDSFTVSVNLAPEADAAIILGAAVHPNGMLSGILQDRVDRGIQLYRAKKVKKLLMSGDHGEASYDEVTAMGRYARQHGVPAEDIFLDHAGFTTYESMYRARDVFQVKRALIVTQAFHISRSVYIARSLGIEAWGVTSNLHSYGGEDYFETRELPARFKAFLQINILHSRPTYLGPVIPITGDGRKTHDRQL